jgi:hypothetical protein
MTKDTKELVIQLLTEKPQMRDNDEFLVAWIWKLELEAMGYPTPNTPSQQFLKMLAEQRFTSSESITRMRRKVQEEFKELRGAKYAKRQANQEKVKKDLGYGQ